MGSARSGTSILTEALNCSPDLLVLAEAGLFSHEETFDIAGCFNAMHVSYGNTRAKGTYLAPGLAAGLGPVALLERLGEAFPYVGEKIAIGPGESWSGARARIIDFHAKHFLRSRYLLTVRSPVECMLSMHKLFPYEQAKFLFDCWLIALETCVDAYRNFPHARWLLFETLGAEAVARATAEMEISLPIPPDLFSRRSVNTRVADDELPGLFHDFAPLCAGCRELYECLRGGICSESLTCTARQGGSQFFNDILARCSELRRHLPA